MNPHLAALQPYPFEKLRLLLSGVVPPTDLRPVRLSIGEPQHPAPNFIRQTLADELGGLSFYPTTMGEEALRREIARWLMSRYALPNVDASTQVLPVNGSREALFAFAQAVVDASKPQALVVSPNPFYQIYEGAAILSGATPVFLNQTENNNFGMDFDSLSPSEWERVQLLYVCSPGNPTGKVLEKADWKALFDLSDRYGFVIASDECYSEIYFGDQPPMGALQAAHALGRMDFRRLVVFSSLSKRSNVPGLRSGFVAGDASILKKFLLYRTYHGCAMSLPIQKASIAAWRDEAHVAENRALYQAKFDAVVPLLEPVLKVQRPQAGFYLWAATPGEDTEFTRTLYEHTNVTVLPGQYLAREAHGVNPGRGYVRIALVAPLEECVEAATRVAAFLR